MPQYFIGAENFTFFYEIDNVIFSNVNFTFYPSSISYIQGKNGSGKTTFLEILLKLKKPRRGSINTSLGVVGYVPSEFSTDFPISVKEFLAISHKYAPNNKRKSKVENLFHKLKKEFYIGNIENAILKNISRGQLQKVLILRAFSYFPNCILLDEPFANLDINSIKILSQFLIEYSHIHPALLFIVDHQQILQNQYPGDIIELQKSQLTFRYKKK